MGLTFPAEYADALKATNGAEGFLVDNYLNLWSCDELVRLNQSYNVAEFAPGFLIFGSDGGGEAYGFDTRNGSWRVFQMPFIAMDWNDAIFSGELFNSFLGSL